MGDEDKGEAFKEWLRKQGLTQEQSDAMYRQHGQAWLDYVDKAITTVHPHIVV
ncbi:hypothetical protein [Streptomyces halobius]|uniref:Uncharacterized protein n=1 Tax=Streptomyces halobius TaxID=2879846 RepID=A0ABY4M4I7_9ACTN|nr:hypothetical protein [Streptomyces halobius]UQA92667.1 hypothetical protein K9S39_13265 [Streptomyces halobius]